MRLCVPRVTAFNDDGNRDAGRAMQLCGLRLGARGVRSATAWSAGRDAARCRRWSPRESAPCSSGGTVRRQRRRASPLRRRRLVAAAEGTSADEPSLEERFMPGPRVAAVAVMGLLAFGVFLGSATSPFAQSAGIAPILLDEGSSSATPSSPAASTPESTPPESAPAATASAPASSAARSDGAARRRRRRSRSERNDAEVQAATGNPQRTGAAAGQARVHDRARRSGVQRSLRSQFTRPIPRKDPARPGGAFVQLLRRSPGRAGQRGRPDQRPGADPADGGELPQLHRNLPRHGWRRKSGHGERLRVSGDDPDAARPARRRRQDLEGLRRGHRQRRRRGAEQLPPPGPRGRRPRPGAAPWRCV